MRIRIDPFAELSGAAAAARTAALLDAAIRARGAATLILATGTSQFHLLERLVRAPVDWRRVTVFHLDEYVGLPASHPASFRRYLRERFVARVPELHAFHEVCGDAPDAEAECRRLGALLRAQTVDVACVGIGENGHLAFNDPPADFDAPAPYLVVRLDDACRRQQLGEGWFARLEDVPDRAISMGIRQILRSRAIVCTVPDARKARAVRDAIEGPVTNRVPASILQTHAACDLFLDDAAAALLRNVPREGAAGRAVAT